MIKNIFHEELISLNEDAEDWKEAIEKSCEKLLEYNYITERYIKSIFKVIEDMGPYFILLNKFALPHASDFTSVNKSGISLSIFNDPITFSNGKDVQVICVLAAEDSYKHLNLLKELSDVLQKENIINKLINCKKKEDIKKIMEEK